MHDDRDISPKATSEGAADVSVIIPCYNQGCFLAEAIESVQAQTHPSYEIVVVNDGSCDHTAEVATRYPAVRYLAQPNQGLAAARNRGLHASRGTFVVFLDADDRLLPQCFATQLQHVRDTPAAQWVCGDYRFFGARDTWHIHRCPATADCYERLLEGNWIGPIHSVMFRRDLVHRVGGFDPTLESCEDQDLYLRIARLSPISCHHQVIAEYRRREGQMSQHWDVMLREAMRMLQGHAAFARTNARLRAAHRRGVAARRRLYGEPLLWRMRAAARHGHWGPAAHDCWTLLRYDPHRLLQQVVQKLVRRRTAWQD